MTPIPRIEGLEDYQTIGPSELGVLLGRSTKSIQVDVSRKPDTLPPRFIVPGNAKVRWRICDVRAWMDAFAALEREKRRAQSDFAKRFPATGYVGHKAFALANYRHGREATKRLNETPE